MIELLKKQLAKKIGLQKLNTIVDNLGKKYQRKKTFALNKQII